MKHKNSHLLVGYWSRLRKGRAIQVFILDVENPGRPIYRLAGTALCERFGFELRGTGFLAHWDAQSSLALAAVLRQSLQLRQPVCLTSVASSAECGMVEIETVLCPVSFNGGEPTRFMGMIQILGDQTQLAGKPIAFQRLAASQLVQEDEPLPSYDNLPPPPPPGGGLRALRQHPRAPHLRLVVSQTRPAAATVHFADQGARDLIRSLEAGFTRPETV
jgi:hypothetical protein